MSNRLGDGGLGGGAADAVAATAGAGAGVCRFGLGYCVSGGGG